MKYDFSTVIDRSGTNACATEAFGVYPGSSPTPPKYDYDFIPMWVADMSFATAPTVQKELIKRVQHPLWGYFIHDDEYYNSIIRWHEKRNGVMGLKREHIGYENGVVGCVSTALNCFAAQGDAILIHSPTYIGFTMTLSANGFKIVHSELKKDENGIYRMDYEDMDRKIKENNIHVAILCTPHNPTGRVWEREELEKAMEVYKANDVIVIADEIWSDLVLYGNKHIPTQSVSEDAKQRTIAVYAPSKTFNLAGLLGSYHIIYNKHLRDRVRSKSEKTHYNSMNILSMHALIGAYKPEGYEWTDELCHVLEENVDYACNYINEHFEGLEVTKPEGTYMLFVDCKEWLEKLNKTIDEVIQTGWDYGIGWQSGVAFHGLTHIRINLALPLSMLKEAFDRMDKFVFNA